MLERAELLRTGLVEGALYDVPRTATSTSLASSVQRATGWRTAPVLDGPVSKAQAYLYRGAPEDLADLIANRDWVTGGTNRH